MRISALRYYRKKNKLTVAKLSAELSIPANTLKSWEKLHRGIFFQEATVFAKYFDVSPTIFVGKKTLEITKKEYQEIYKRPSIYIPNELKVQEKYKRLIDLFLYRKASNLIKPKNLI